MIRAALLHAIAVGGALLVLGCTGRDQASGGATAQPEPITDHECGACGMIVREQPSPRGQLVHRDGTHVWLCSMADVVAYAAAPSPHGRVEELWVETLPRDVDPAADSVEERPWARVEDAHFVLGVARESVMGEAVLAFETEADARAAAERLHGRTASWDEVVRVLGGSS